MRKEITLIVRTDKEMETMHDDAIRKFFDEKGWPVEKSRVTCNMVNFENIFCEETGKSKGTHVRFLVEDIPPEKVLPVSVNLGRVT